MPVYTHTSIAYINAYYHKQNFYLKINDVHIFNVILFTE